MAARAPATMSIDTSASLREEAELYAKSTESGNLLPRVHAASGGQGFPADAGFIEITSEFIISNYVKDFIIARITFDGYEYLESVRSDTVWASVKNRLSSIGGNASLEVVKTLASSMVLKQLGI